MTTFKFALGLLGVATLATGTAMAQEADNPPADWRQTFVSVAGDDGVISEAEYITYKTEGDAITAEEAKARFDDIAGDDGILTYLEVEATMVEKTEVETTEEDGS